MAETSLRKFLKELSDNLNILEQREAKFANAAPLDLLNQIDDYHYAITLTRQAMDQDVPLDELQTEFSTLNLELDTVVFIAQEPPPRQEFTGENPYRGLRKFTEADAKLFFGRTTAIEGLLNIVKYLVDTETGRDAPDLVAVLGPSGSGKSSLVRAGLIPKLRQGELPGSDQWPIKVMVPGAHPLDALAAQFVGSTGRGLPTLRADLDTGEQALHQLMLESLVDKPDDAVFVLVIDQFEEFFTLCENEIEKQAFLAQLLHVTQTRHNRGFVILTMRADFYGKAAQYQDLAQVITRNQMLVSPMTERELREAILLPAEAVGLELEKALVESLLKDTADAPGVLPLLQHTLLELFERRDGNLLTLEAYQEIGGVKGSLAHRADAVMGDLTPDERRVARRIFMRLIQPGEGTMDTRRRTTFDEVRTQTIQTKTVESVVEALVDGNLLIKGHNPETNEVVLDVSHEALIQEWPQLRRWLDEDRRGFRIRRQLSQTVRQWEERGHDADSLYRGGRLVEVEEWLAANPDEINPSEAEFIASCRAARERSRRRTRMVIAGLTAGLVIALVGAAFGWWGQQRAATERDNAQVAQTRAEEQARIARAGQLAAQAQNAIEMWPQRAQLLALEAIDVTMQNDGSPLPAAEQALRDAWLKAGGTPLSDHNFDVEVAAVSPDGEWLATGNLDGTVLLWDLTDPEAVPRDFSDDGFLTTAVAVSSEGERLIVGNWDGAIRLWDLADPGADSRTLSGHDDLISAMAITPDGEQLVTGSGDGTVLRWDLLDLEC